MADVLKGVGGGGGSTSTISDAMSTTTITAAIAAVEVVEPSTSSSNAAAETTNKSSIKITSNKRTNGSNGNGNNGGGNGVRATTSSGSGGAIVASEFKSKLDSLLETKPSISKEKMNQIVQEAIRSAKYYKHVVYYVESFIKKCPREFKISGLYIIDAIIRNTKSSSSSPSSKTTNKDVESRNGHSNKTSKSSTAKIKDVYNKRFAINMCKTFTNLFSKANKIEREKLNKVLKLWQKYKVLDVEIMDKLFRISSTSKIDSVINSANNSGEALDESSTAGGETKRRKTTTTTNNNEDGSGGGVNETLNKTANNSSSAITSPVKNANDDRSPSSDTHNEISKILAFENDLDSDSDQDAVSLTKRRSLNRSKHSPGGGGKHHSKSPTAESAESRYKTSINNCAAWLESNVVSRQQQQQQQQQQTPVASTSTPTSATKTSGNKITINLPDLSQPPPPILKSATTTPNVPAPVPPPPNINTTTTPTNNSNSSAAAVTAFLNSRFQPSTTATSPPPPPLPPLPKTPVADSMSREKDRERLKRGLSKIRPNHLCICSKTIWLGHLSKTTTEEMLITEITNIIEHSSSSSSSKKSKSSSSKGGNESSARKVIVDVNLIPPRGCAFVELVDRKMAAKCLDRMKEGYRLDASHIKVAWATNKGINQDRRIKQHWNVEIGCTYIPWSDLEAYSRDSIEFLKWVDGGILDEDSLPGSYRDLYNKHMAAAASKAAAAANNNNNNNNNSRSDANRSTSHIVHEDMELDDDDVDERRLDMGNNSHLNVSITTAGIRQQGHGQQTGPITPPIPPPPPPPQQILMVPPPPPHPPHPNAASTNLPHPPSNAPHHHMVGLVPPPPPQDVGQQGALFMPAAAAANSLQMGNFRLNTGPLPTLLNAAQHHASAIQQFNLAAAVNAARQQQQQQQQSTNSALNGSSASQPGAGGSQPQQFFAPLYHHPSLAAAAQFLQQPRSGGGTGGPPPPQPPPPPPSSTHSFGSDVDPNKIDPNKTAAANGGFFLIVNKQQPGAPNPNPPQQPPHQPYSNMQFIQAAAQFPSIFHHQAMLNNSGGLGNQLRFLDQQAAAVQHAQQHAQQAALAAAAAAASGGPMQVEMVPPPPTQQQMSVPKPLMSIDASDMAIKKT